jgi:diacylglycerol kinase family enzyme
MLLRRKTALLTRLPFQELSVTSRRPRPWEIDGEVMGSALQLTVSVRPGSLLVRVPSSRPL